jgi:hypothetical protein
MVGFEVNASIELSFVIPRRIHHISIFCRSVSTAQQDFVLFCDGIVPVFASPLKGGRCNAENATGFPPQSFADKEHRGVAALGGRGQTRII